VSEKPLFSFLALFAALFSIKVLSGFFLFCFLLSLPLLMLAAPYSTVFLVPNIFILFLHRHCFSSFQYPKFCFSSFHYFTYCRT
jgi:hypothetical protein